MKNFICFTKERLLEMFKFYSLEWIKTSLKTENIPIENLLIDSELRLRKTSEFANFARQNTDIQEIFSSIHLSDFYSKEDSEIGIIFELKDSVNKNQIKSLFDLITNLEKNTDIDFGIKSYDGVRLFQLKTFHEKNKYTMSTRGLIDFIIEILKKYGGQIEDTNILIILQKKEISEKIDFESISNKLKKVSTNKGEILLEFNDNNENLKIIRLYPELAQRDVTINWNNPEMLGEYKRGLEQYRNK